MNLKNRNVVVILTKIFCRGPAKLGSARVRGKSCGKQIGQTGFSDSG